MLLNYKSQETVLSEFLQKTMGFCQDNDAGKVQHQLHIAIDECLRELIDWQNPYDESLSQEFYGNE